MKGAIISAKSVSTNVNEHIDRTEAIEIDVTLEHLTYVIVMLAVGIAKIQVFLRTPSTVRRSALCVDSGLEGVSEFRHKSISSSEILLAS